MTRKPQPGWRFFDCEECGDKRWVATRDCFSPSNNNCGNPECDNVINPSKLCTDPRLPVDVCGNLTARFADLIGETSPLNQVDERPKLLEQAADHLRTILDLGMPGAENHRHEKEVSETRAAAYELLGKLGK